MKTIPPGLISIAITVGTLLIGCLASNSLWGQDQSMVAKDWQKSTPEAEGMDQTKLDDLDARIKAGRIGYVDAVVIIRHGKLIYQKAYARDYVPMNAGKNSAVELYNYYCPKYHPFYEDTKLHSMQSVTKSVVSTIYGVAIQNGHKFDLDKPIASFFKEYEIANMNVRKEKITLGNLLNMRGGFDWDEGSTSYDDPANTFKQMVDSADWVKFVLDRPMTHEPGSKFVYNSGISIILAVIFKKVTGHDVDTYAREHLFGPIGIKEYYWKKTPRGVTDGQEGLYITAESLAKIGQLVLNDGKWDEKQIVSKDWMNRITRPQPAEKQVSKPRYGFQWWFDRHKKSGDDDLIVTGYGYGGQRLYIGLADLVHLHD